MPGNRTHIKRERDNPHPNIDDYRHRHHHDRSRSPRDKVDKGKGKGKVKRSKEEEEEKEEKKVLVRKRVKEGEYTPKLNYPEWLLWVAGAAISREDRKKHTYSLEKRGSSGASSGKDKGKGKGNDREHIGKKEYLEEEKWGHGHDHQGGQSRDDDNDDDDDDDDDGYRSEAERLNAKMEELLKLPHHVLEDMREEEEARHNEMLKPNYWRRKYGAEKREWNNDERETVYERYMRSLREVPWAGSTQSQSNVQHKTMKETELEGQARRERESWDRFRRKRKEEGIQGDENERERQKEIFIRGERYVKQEPRDMCSPKESSMPPSVCIVTEHTAGDDRGRMSQILRRLEDFMDSMQLGSNPATDNQRSKQKVKNTEEGMEMMSEVALAPLWKSLLGLNLGNSFSPPTPPPSSYSRLSRGSNRGRILPKRRYSKKNTVELIGELNACPSPSRQAYLERSSWRRERPLGVEYASPSAIPVPTRPQASFSPSYPPPPTVVTVSESDESSHHQQEPENEDPTHRVYRVPSYRVHPTADPYPPHHVSGPTANMRRPRRRDFSDELPTATSSHGHRRHP